VVIREGDAVPIVAATKSVHDALEAAERLGKEGVSEEVIGLRSRRPIDVAASASAQAAGASP
jgi:acetoin:2,6-dichlorophenolindophenol oxidoreductase subunit beta